LDARALDLAAAHPYFKNYDTCHKNCDSWNPPGTPAKMRKGEETYAIEKTSNHNALFREMKGHARQIFATKSGCTLDCAHCTGTDVHGISASAEFE
jgi:hypothetical protein